MNIIMRNYNNKSIDRDSEDEDVEIEFLLFDHIIFS